MTNPHDHDYTNTSYTTLSHLRRAAHTQHKVRLTSYGRRQPIKTLWVGIALDLIVPFTFGGITVIMRRVFGEILFYVPKKE